MEMAVYVAIAYWSPPGAKRHDASYRNRLRSRNPTYRFYKLVLFRIEWVDCRIITSVWGGCRHADTYQFKTTLVADLPRVEYPDKLS